MHAIPRRLLWTVIAQVALAAVSTRQLLGAPEHAITYRIEDWRGDGTALAARFSVTQLQLLEKLNRCDLDCLARRRGSVVLAEPSDAGELAYSPLPHRWPQAERLQKALVVYVPLQAFGAYENGVLVRWGPVSSGRKDRPTPPGVYHLNWRSPGRHSTVNPNWFMRWYFNIDNKRGISMHAYALPGYPASHACVRMLERDARWLFDWGQGWLLDQPRTGALARGTPVWIVGRYDFSSPPLWQSADPAARIMPPALLPVPDGSLS